MVEWAAEVAWHEPKYLKEIACCHLRWQQALNCIQPWLVRCGFEGMAALLCFVTVAFTNHFKQAGTSTCKTAHSPNAAHR